MERFAVSKEIQFDAGHRVPNHVSKCRNPHGHRYRVVAYFAKELVTKRGASNQGMVEDFGDLKAVMMEEVHDVLDHGFMVWKDDFKLIDMFAEFGDSEWKIITMDHVPTAENIAQWCFERIKKRIEYAEMVEVYETPTSIAYYPWG